MKSERLPSQKTEPQIFLQQKCDLIFSPYDRHYTGLLHSNRIESKLQTSPEQAKHDVAFLEISKAIDILDTNKYISMSYIP